MFVKVLANKEVEKAGVGFMDTPHKLKIRENKTTLITRIYLMFPLNNDNCLSLT